MKTMLLALMAALMGSGAACVVAPGGSHTGIECVVPVGHVHDDLCGHYHFGGRWYYLHGHRHGNSCGHVVIEGAWTIGH